MEFWQRASWLMTLSVCAAAQMWGREWTIFRVFNVKIQDKERQEDKTL